MAGKSLFESIKAGSTVTIGEDERQGRAVLRGPADSWVLNMGGAHGKPGIATPENVVAVEGRTKKQRPLNLRDDAGELYEVSRKVVKGGPNAGKVQFHRHGKRVLKGVLKLLGVPGDVRCSLGGPAVLGEVILHTDHVYVMLCTHMHANGKAVQFIYRSCKGRKDYAGGQNRFYSYHDLANHPEGFVEVLQELARRATD